jgi:ribosomal-protein-alanine N-acetyltransferase
MRLEDVDEVGQIDRDCFSTPWPSSAYRREIRENKLGRYVVLECTDTAGPVTPVAGNGAGADSGLRRAFSTWLRPFGLNSDQRTESARRTRIVGFAGLWLMLDEAHITTIGVLPGQRGRGLGEWLMSHIMDVAREIGAQRVTLEVRVSNSVAQRMYRKFGFATEGVRPRYYSDNQEDALIMWSERLDSTDYLERLEAIKTEINERVRTVTVT